LNVEAPVFSPAVVSCPPSTLNSRADTFVPQAEQAWSQEPAKVEEQSVLMDERLLGEYGDNSATVVSLAASPSGCFTTDSLTAEADSDSTSNVSPKSRMSADSIEYSNQRSLLCQDPEIHHVNWLGQGVMVRTSTLSAVSLAVAMMPAPARIIDEEDLRGQAILREAMLTIDPVIYYGDINELKHLKGERLREAVIGSTAPYYTRFGCWKDDMYDEDDERPLQDELDLTRYIEDTTIVNGWLENAAPTRQSFWDYAKESCYSKLDVQRRAANDRKLFGVGHTPLRHAIIADGSEHGVFATQQPSADVSGLISAAAHCSQSTAAYTASVKSRDDLFKNANWTDDLDDEKEIVDVTQAPPVDQLHSNSSPVTLNNEVLTQCHELLDLTSVREATDTPTSVKSSKPVPFSDQLSLTQVCSASSLLYRFRKLMPNQNLRKKYLLQRLSRLCLPSMRLSLGLR
jgi:hypothetical protein